MKVDQTDLWRLEDKLLQKIRDLDFSLEDVRSRLSVLDGPPVVKVKKVHPDAVIPKYQSEGAAGLDLVAVNDETITLWSDSNGLIPTGISLELPPGYEAQVRPRSGLAAKNKITVLNTPGTIDSDYRGEVKVLLYNHGPTFRVNKGERIAQLVITRVSQAILEPVQELSKTARGADGFGSTGVIG